MQLTGRATVISSILSDEGVDPLQAVINPVFGCSLHDVKPDDRKLRSVPTINDRPQS